MPSPVHIDLPSQLFKQASVARWWGVSNVPWADHSGTHSAPLLTCAVSQVTRLPPVSAPLESTAGTMVKTMWYCVPSR